MTTGTVTLPRRPVHVGVWLRMLRTLLDEASISTSRVRQRSVTALEQIWDATGWSPRAGLNMWRPYEALGAQRQEAMLEPPRAPWTSSRPERSPHTEHSATC